ncbi:MAG TPA: class I SAM-dependent methyltransferase [Pseudobdellovibrionaceae bacterium]|jgi:SAM-dependent methyltransferase
MLSETEQKQKDYYNSIAVTYDQHYSNEYALTYRNKQFDSFLEGQDLQGKLVLDACCGGGQNTSYFLSRGAKVIGMDISEKQCEHFAKHYPQAEVVCGSVLVTSFPDAHFDFIVTESFHHLHPYTAKGLKEYMRILKPGGKLFLWEPHSGSILDFARKIWYRLDSNYFEENESSINIEEFKKYLKGTAQVKKIRYGGDLAFLAVMSSMHFRIPPKWVGLYAKLFCFLEKLWSPLQSRFTSCWVMAMFEKNMNNKKDLV